MAILFSIAGLEFGGSEVFLLRITKKLSTREKIVVFNTKPQVRDQKLLTYGLGKRVTLINAPSYFILKYLPFLNRLNKKLILDYRIDALALHILLFVYNIKLVCSFKYHSDTLICSVLKNKRIPVVVAARGCYSLMYHALVSDKIRCDYFIKETENVFKRADALIWLTQKNIDILEQTYVSIPALNTQIYNGYEQNSAGSVTVITKEQLNIPSGAFVFGMIARGIKEKGWQEAIEAFILCKPAAAIEMHLILIGGGGYMDELKDLYPQKYIHFLGKLENPVDYIKVFDVALLPSYFEGESIPNTIIEYLYCHKPVIATNWVEIPNMLRVDSNRYAGFITELTKEGIPDVSDIAEKMHYYITQTGLLQEHILLAEKAFEKFSMEKCADSYMHFFNKVIHEHRSH